MVYHPIIFIKNNEVKNQKFFAMDADIRCAVIHFTADIALHYSTIVNLNCRITNRHMGEENSPSAENLKGLFSEPDIGCYRM